jgi:peptidoglycan/LPS O-acetylase OafA/YrhL
LPYVGALDGVRALAVAGVLLYHGGVAWLPGGFLGVDLFFVLSGFLITSLLLAEREATGRIDLGRFWVRRARRLLPAAFAVIGVCLVVVALLPPGEAARTRADALASLGYVNNWHQVLAERSYFESFGRPSLLEHLWSLAVEEQFYLLWPLLLGFGLSRLGRRRTAIVTLTAAAASGLAMGLLFEPGSDPSRVYFGTDTHASGLLAGALLAFLWPLGRFRATPHPSAVWVLDATALPRWRRSWPRWRSCATTTRRRTGAGSRPSASRPRS